MASDHVRLVHKLEVGPGLSAVRPSCCAWPAETPPYGLTNRRAGDLLHQTRPGVPGDGPGRSTEQGAGRTAIGPGHGCWVLP